MGLVFVSAKHFARMNPGILILACRSEEKGKVAASRITSETGCTSVEV